MTKARGVPFHGTAAAASTSTTALGDAEPIFGCAKDAGMVPACGMGLWAFAASSANVGRPPTRP